MKPCDIIIRAQEIVRQRAPLYKDPRFIAVAGALAAKKLLFFDQCYPAPKKKISIADILWVGENLEPRVLEVFPAALLRFPSLFKAAKKRLGSYMSLWEEMRVVVRYIVFETWDQLFHRITYNPP